MKPSTMEPALFAIVTGTAFATLSVLLYPLDPASGIACIVIAAVMIGLGISFIAADWWRDRRRR